VDILEIPRTSERFCRALWVPIGIDELIDEGCDCDSRKEHKERMKEGEGEPIDAAGIRMIVSCTNLNNDAANVERSHDLRRKARSLRQGFKLQQSHRGATASEPRPC